MFRVSTTLALSLFLALLSAACIVTKSERSPAETPVIRSTRPERMWNLISDGKVVGSVVLFQSESDNFFSIRNEWQQDVGMVDATGRAWAFVPHQEEAEWMGSGSVLQGASKILGLLGDPEMREVPLDARSL